MNFERASACAGGGAWILNAAWLAIARARGGDAGGARAAAARAIAAAAATAEDAAAQAAARALLLELGAAAAR